MSKFIDAAFTNGNKGVVYTQKVYQYDRGVVLSITGLDLPETYQVHFSDNEVGGVATAKIVTGENIVIPDAYLQTGHYIHVWIFDTGEEGDFGTSEHEIIIPVIPRPAAMKISDITAGLAVSADYDEEEHALIFRHERFDVR